MNQNTQKIPLKIAAPYYGALNHPVRGLSRLYFLLDVNPEAGRVNSMHVSVWNPDETGDLGTWLQKMGATTICCNGIENNQELELAESGIRVESIKCRDIIDGVMNWLSQTGTGLFKPSQLMPS